MNAKLLGFFSGFPTHHFPLEITERLREELAVRESLVFVSAWPSDYERNDSDSTGMHAMFEECNMPFKRYSVIDNRTAADEARRLIQEASCIFLMGGHGVQQFQLICDKGILEEIRKSTAVILGVSAGSSNMAKRALDIWESPVPYDGLGLANITIKAHVTKENQEMLQTLSQISVKQNLPICAMEDESAIFVKEKEAAYVGQILWINNGNICPISQKILNQMTAIEQGCMNCAAVVFDLFETLITEWGHKKYTKREMCADLGLEREKFDLFWDEKEEERYCGKISFADSIRYVCEKCGRQIADSVLAEITDKRENTKAQCFEHVDPEVYQLLEHLKAMGMRLAIVSNCSSEEVKVIRQSRIYHCFDQVILSYETGLQKPDIRIYEKAAELLGVATSECIFVGDGGSNELEGARMAGMKAIQAKWYTNRHPQKRDSKAGFLAAEEPLDILRVLV